MKVASRWMIANIASDDALILPYRANPAGLNFRERQGFASRFSFFECPDDGLASTRQMQAAVHSITLSASASRPRPQQPSGWLGRKLRQAPIRPKDGRL